MLGETGQRVDRFGIHIVLRILVECRQLFKVISAEILYLVCESVQFVEIVILDGIHKLAELAAEFVVIDLNRAFADIGCSESVNSLSNRIFIAWKEEMLRTVIFSKETAYDKLSVIVARHILSVEEQRRIEIIDEHKTVWRFDPFARSDKLTGNSCEVNLGFIFNHHAPAVKVHVVILTDGCQ